MDTSETNMLKFCKIKSKCNFLQKTSNCLKKYTAADYPNTSGNFFQEKGPGVGKTAATRRSENEESDLVFFEKFDMIGKKAVRGGGTPMKRTDSAYTEKHLMTAFFLAALAGLLFLIWSFWKSDAGDALPLRNTSRLELVTSYQDGIQVQTVRLPDRTPLSVMFKTTHTKVEVYAGEELIYRSGWEEKAFPKSPGTLWHIVSIPEGHAGGTLRICIYPVYANFYGNTSVLYCGTKSACVLERLTDILPILIINCVIVFAGILSIFLHFFTRSRREKHEIGSFLCLGLFALTIVVWSLCQCGFLQFVIPDGRTLYFVDFFSFFLFPVPFNLFVYTVCRTKYRWGFAALSVAYLVNMVLETAIQMTGLLDIFQMMSVTHVLMAVNGVYVFWAIGREVRLTDNENAKRFRLPLYIVMVFGLAELAAYYFRGFRDTSVFLPTGTILFIVMLVWIQVAQYYRTMLEEQKLAYFEKLANMDILTEALNRNAYEDTLKRLERQELEVKATCVVLFDINDMKYINDNFGHEKGDEALKSCYHCIRQSFDPSGKCFRIGGDEFVYIACSAQDLAAEKQRFEELILQESEKFEFPFSVACGYASYDPARDRTVRDVIRRSDEMMYQNKKKKEPRSALAAECVRAAESLAQS